ncbi:hypothetical protein ACFQ3Z_15775 [Streptomyces nogalater]
MTEPLLAEEDAWRRELRKSGHYPLTPHRGGQDNTLRGTVHWLRLNLHWACGAPGRRRPRPGATPTSRRDARPGVRRPPPTRGPRTPLSDAARGHAEDDPAAPKCRGQLTYDPRKSVIRCDTCRRAYGPHEWDIVGARASSSPCRSRSPPLRRRRVLP